MNLSTLPRVLLVSVRAADDPMAAHELECFARITQLPVSQFSTHPILLRPVDRADISAHDAVIIGGSGAFSVLDPHAWLHDLHALIHTLTETQTPTWAACFGFQAMALALGGNLIHDPKRIEMGGTALHLTQLGAQDTLTRTLPSTFWVQQGHHDHVIALPSRLKSLARGDKDCEQLIRVDGLPFYGSQFHPELRHRDLVFRFQFYADHYQGEDPEQFTQRLAALPDTPDTPEVGAMLAQLVRGALA